MAVLPPLLRDARAGLLVTDYTPLREGRAAREGVAAALEGGGGEDRGGAEAGIPVAEVDAHNVVRPQGWVTGGLRGREGRGGRACKSPPVGVCLSGAPGGGRKPSEVAAPPP